MLKTAGNTVFGVPALKPPMGVLIEMNSVLVRQPSSANGERRSHRWHVARRLRDGAARLGVIALCAVILAGCQQRYEEVEEIRTRLDAFPAGEPDEAFVQALATEYEQAKRLIGYQGDSRWGKVAASGRVITLGSISRDTNWIGEDLGSAGRGQILYPLSLLLWLGSSRVEAIERVEAEWVDANDLGVPVRLEVAVTPSLIQVDWTDPLLTRNYLHSHETDSRNRLYDTIRDEFFRGSEAVRYVVGTGSGRRR